MTFSSQPVTVMRCKLGYCGNTYGVAPCTATGSAGSECYNTWKTCQDKENYTAINRWHQFVTQNQVGIPPIAPAQVTHGFADGNHTNTLSAITNEPEVLPIKIDPANSLGDRGTITVQMMDQPWHDLDLDPYASTRSYTPIDQGTYFGKLKARQYIEGRVAEVYTVDIDGATSIDLTAGTKRTHIVQRVDGPNNDGAVQWTLIDPLSLVINSKVQIPAQSEGLLVGDLAASLVATTAYIEPFAGYPASGKIRMGSEVCGYTRSGNVFTLSRASSNSTLEAHSDGDAVQLVKEYSNATIDEVIYDVMSATGADASWLPQSEWAASLTPWRTELLSFEVAEPTDASQLLQEVLVDHSLSFWWDESNAKFVLQPLIPSEGVGTIDETNHILENSFELEELAEDRVSRIYVYYGQHDPTKSLDDETNWRVVKVIADADAESANEYGSQGIRKIFARTIGRNQTAIAQSIAALVIFQYRDTPFNMRWRLGPTAAESYQLGDVLSVNQWSLQDETGANVDTAVQIIERREVEPGGPVEYTGIRFPLAGRFARYASYDLLEDLGGFHLIDASGNRLGKVHDKTFSTATTGDKQTNAYYADASGLMPDGSLGYGYYPG